MKRTFFVTPHASHRFRKRFLKDEASPPDITDEALVFLLNESMDRDAVMTVRDSAVSHRPSTLTIVEDKARFGDARCVALIRENAVVTVVDVSMLAGKVERKEWEPIAQGAGWPREDIVATPTPATPTPATPTLKVSPSPADKKVVIADVEHTLRVLLTTRAVGAFKARNDPLAQMLRDLTDELPKQLTEALVEGAEP